MSGTATESSLLSIGDVAMRTGIAPGTVRMWESRHGFPRPARLPGGHRRYSERDVDVLREVARFRDAGLSVEAAVARALRSAEGPARSIFAGLQRRRPDVAAHVLPKRALLGLSHAIEDEYCARAERALLFGAFQREKFYRQTEGRWRELAKTAYSTVVLAEFEHLRVVPGAPTEVPLAADDPLTREWALVCDAPRYGACLAAWELPGQDGVADPERRFESLWSVDPRVVREAARVATGLAAASVPDLAHRLARPLEEEPPSPGRDELAVLSELTSRMVAYVAGSAAGPSG